MGVFLNFVLHESMQALRGIDLTKFCGEAEKQTEKPKLLWERRVRAAIGLKSLPYQQAVKGVLVVKEVILGN